MNKKTEKIIKTHLIATTLGILAAFYITDGEDIGAYGKAAVVSGIVFINWLAAAIYLFED